MDDAPSKREGDLDSARSAPIDASKSTQRVVQRERDPAPIQLDSTVLTRDESAPPERDSGDSTMLSAPAPADRYEADLEDRVTRAEGEIVRLSARVETLEARKPIQVVDRADSAAAMRPLILWVLAVILLGAFWLIFGRSGG